MTSKSFTPGEQIRIKRTGELVTFRAWATDQVAPGRYVKRAVAVDSNGRQAVWPKAAVESASAPARRQQHFHLLVRYPGGALMRRSFANADTARGRARWILENARSKPVLLQVIRKTDKAVILDALTGEKLPMEHWYDGIE